LEKGRLIMKTLLTILISLISLIGYDQNTPCNNYDLQYDLYKIKKHENIDWDSIAEQTTKRLNDPSWYIKEYEDQLEKWRNPAELDYSINSESILDSVMSGFLDYYQQYSRGCYADSVDVCVFNTFLDYGNEILKWAEYDCKYYQQYKNIYHCGEPYEKWTHPSKPNLPDFMKWLEGKLE